MEGKKVYDAICNVQKELAEKGISKENENEFDHYKFRGIDDVYNALAPILAKNRLCVLPRMTSRSCEERKSRKGDPLFYVTVDAEFDFVSAEDASIHTVKVFGEAMDRSDKATNKAMSAAFKYACFQAFCIPTEGDNDADADTPEPEAKGKQKASEPGKQGPTPKQLLFTEMQKKGLDNDQCASLVAFAGAKTDEDMTKLTNNFDTQYKEWQLAIKEEEAPF